MSMLAVLRFEPLYVAPDVNPSPVGGSGTLSSKDVITFPTMNDTFAFQITGELPDILNVNFVKNPSFENNMSVPSFICIL